MINLVIDIGNTFTKIAIFNNRELVKSAAYQDFTESTISNFINGHNVDNSIVSAVEDPAFDLESHLKSFSNYQRFSTSIKTNVSIRYKTPETLGLDRYAAVIGAHNLYCSQDILVIDSGTCVTYDFVDREGNYPGGVISPGLKMRLTAMNYYTGRLPLFSPDPEFDQQSGNDTLSCMLAGAQTGLIHEAAGFINYYKQQHPDIKILLCGGDAPFFDRQLKNSIFAPIVKTEPHLVLSGLNEVIHQIND
ncbi:type III pantothenate kinase [Pedobacter sp. HMF7647]|uniref:Type III pantothenate kinase n=1 Tax=Hufsiella arboris TaxID=2695275 RepID=A0A7K1YAS9_9SPHI|nr:type III pantothenate kinase [Hufsiella arboris]MXV51684.1 type III pantothenate kinase [Hufsiella arboris]